MKLLVYDVETKRPIPERGMARLDGVEYAKGWTDYDGMGVSVICAYEWDTGYRVFLEDNFGEFKALAEDSDTLVIGFNNRRFDDVLIAMALGIVIPANRSFDLLRAIRIARGDSGESVGGGSLDAVARGNFLQGKTGSGAFAPIQWQRGQLGRVIDYCLRDVLLLARLIELVQAQRLRDPENGRILPVTLPPGILS